MASIFSGWYEKVFEQKGVNNEHLHSHGYEKKLEFFTRKRSSTGSASD